MNANVTSKLFYETRAKIWVTDQYGCYVWKYRGMLKYVNLALKCMTKQETFFNTYLRGYTINIKKSC